MLWQHFAQDEVHHQPGHGRWEEDHAHLAREPLRRLATPPITARVAWVAIVCLLCACDLAGPLKLGRKQRLVAQTVI